MEYTNAWLRYEETSTMDNIICKMQAHARVCEENIEELEETSWYFNISKPGVTILAIP